MGDNPQVIPGLHVSSVRSSCIIGTYPLLSFFISFLFSLFSFLPLSLFPLSLSLLPPFSSSGACSTLFTSIDSVFQHPFQLFCFHSSPEASETFPLIDYSGLARESHHHPSLGCPTSVGPGWHIHLQQTRAEAKKRPIYQSASMGNRMVTNGPRSP